MSLLIPGKIRQEGVQLYKDKMMSVDYGDSGLLTAYFDDVSLSYDLTCHFPQCSCSLFLGKGYCEHLAALEHFLKHDNEGQDICRQYQSLAPTSSNIEPSMGRLFLEGLAFNQDDFQNYRLSAHASLNTFASEFWWTFKINRLPDRRSYVIKDIFSFLRIVMQEDYYQIGKNYYEKLSLNQFDEASQAVILFLWRLFSESNLKGDTFFFKHDARYMLLPSGFFKEGVMLMNALYDFSIEEEVIHKNIYFKPLTEEAALFKFKVLVNDDGIVLRINEKAYRSYMNDAYLFLGDTFYELTREQIRLVKQLHTLPISADLAKEISFGFEDQPKLALSLLLFKTMGVVEAPTSFIIHDFEPIFRFDIGLDHDVLLDVCFDYGDYLVKSKNELEALPFTSNIKKEDKVFALMQSEGFRPIFQSSKPRFSHEGLFDFFHEGVERFRKVGRVELSDAIKDLRVEEKPRLAIDLRDSLLEVSFDFSDLDFRDIETAKEALRRQQPYFTGHRGQLVVFDDETNKINHALTYLRSGFDASKKVRLPLSSVYQLAQTFGHFESVNFSDTCQSLLKNLAHPETYPLPEVCLKLPLRDYQRTGVAWLTMLEHYGFGGILADDMGLGKTIQTIAFLKGQMTATSKILILSPSSLIYNWQDEFHRFAPECDVTVVYGSKTLREDLISEGGQILITSYSSFRQDIDLYQKEEFDYLILDEAQMIKNSQTKLAKALRDFNVKSCFALSGTPIENHLLEIWSIFQIVLPGLLPTKKDFLKLSPQEVALYIKPFVLRRQKEQVLQELPDLLETTYYNELADEQKALYLAQLDQIQGRLAGRTEREFQKQRIEILSGVTRLRQICDSPELFMDYEGESGKLDSLRQLLIQLKENGRRALIFSQFKGMLLLAEQVLKELDLTAYMLTGSTPALERQKMTRAFNKGSRDMFLISLKAGGVGLNLTGADTVILIDLWWNPAVDNQAISRAHRLGQQKAVEVYRLITRGTIEERILDLQDRKKELVTKVMDGQDSKSTLTLAELQTILGVRF